MTCITIDPVLAGVDPDRVTAYLEAYAFGPLFHDCQVVGGSVVEHLFQVGLCLPSGTAMSSEDLDRIVAIVCGCWE